MAHKKAGSTAKTNRDSNPKMLGVKLFGGQNVAVGQIIVRQRGTHFYPGEGVKLGNDHTIYATMPGVVEFTKRQSKTVVQVREER